MATERGTSAPGTGDPEASELEAPVTWIDRFGNVQLALVPGALTAVGVAPGGLALVTTRSGPEGGDDGGGGGGAASPAVTARRVRAFGHLAPGEFGLLEDANGQVSVVLDRASAAQALGLSGTGAIVHIAAVGSPGTRKPPTPGG